jgi:hypothetical protein
MLGRVVPTCLTSKSKETFHICTVRLPIDEAGFCSIIDSCATRSERSNEVEASVVRLVVYSVVRLVVYRPVQSPLVSYNAVDSIDVAFHNVTLRDELADKTHQSAFNTKDRNHGLEN